MDQQPQVLNKLQDYCHRNHAVVVPVLALTLSHFLFTVNGFIPTLIAAGASWFALEYYKKYKQ